MKRIRIAIATGIGVLLLATAAMAQAVPPIPDRNASPTIATGPDGAIHVAWLEGALGESTILYSRLEGTSWTQAEVVATGVGALDPIILVRPDGVPCVFWTLVSLTQACRDDGQWSAGVEVARESNAASYAPAFGPDGQLRVMHAEPPNSVFYGDYRLNGAEDVATFQEFTVDANGGLHAFWYDFAAEGAWLWSYSTDDGVSWTPPESLSTMLPNASGTFVGADGGGRVVSVLADGFSIEHRMWTPGSGWSETETMEFIPGAVSASTSLQPNGIVTVAVATSDGALTFEHPPGGRWIATGAAEGTDGRSIDAVLIASDLDGTAEILWHELGAVGFNTGLAGGESIVTSVPSITDLSVAPLVVATSVAVTAGVVFLVPFPAEIFNQTMAKHHDEIRGWFRKRRRRSAGARFWDRPAGLVAFLALSALLFGFLDPGFGLNGDSIAIFIGLLIGVVATTLGFALPTLLMRRARSKEWGRLQALPLALLVGLACVVVSRVINFVPGYLYGIVLGLAFTRDVGEEDEAREVAVSSLVLLVGAVASWVLLGVIRSGAVVGFFDEVGEAALATITVAAFEALAIGLLPLRGMPGRVLFAARKKWWLPIWAISVLAFFHALVNPQSGYLVSSALVPVATTVGLLLGFTLFSVGLWGFFALKERRET